MTWYLWVALLWLALLLIQIYAGHQALLVLFHVEKDTDEAIAGIGGLLYILALIIMISQGHQVPREWSLVILLWAIVFLITPRLHRIIIIHKR